MENIYQDMAVRTGGSIYIGVVGPVRTGKSTLIKRIMEAMVIPAISDPTKVQRARDELPQSGSGKTIMTTEPKFVPEEAVEIIPDGTTKLRIRLIDSVGYMVEGAVGAAEDGKPRMVSTPWQPEPIPMTEAAELGTKKVMEEHASIGIVVTTDGTITDIPRSDYVHAEQKAIEDIRKTGKPFVTIINTSDPMGEAAANLHRELKARYGIHAAIADCQALTAEGCAALLQDLLCAFPLGELRVYLPGWAAALEEDSPILTGLYEALLERCAAIGTIAQAEAELSTLSKLEQLRSVSIDSVELGTGTVHCRIQLPESLYYDTLSRRAGVPIRSEAELLHHLAELTAAKRDYDRIRDALQSARSSGCGVVMPDRTEVALQKPELVKKGGSCGVRLRCSASGIQMMRMDLQAELSPMVGSEEQAQDLLQRLSAEQEEVLDSNLFGKTVWELVSNDLQAKVSAADPQTLEKFRQSLNRILSEGAQGLICIIL